jgi:hypothetical protein
MIISGIHSYKLASILLLVAGVWKGSQIFEVVEDQVSRSVSATKEEQQLQQHHPHVTVEETDYIYSSHLGAAPIVLENHKLIFFYVPKVGCSVWKKLFRRMMGYEDWQTESPHNSRTNGLVYLNQLNLTHATQILNDPEYTRAIIVRDPKEQFLLAYLDKVLHDNATYVVGACCKVRVGVKVLHPCWEQAQTFQGFFNLTATCLDTH